MVEGTQSRIWTILAVVLATAGCGQGGEGRALSEGVGENAASQVATSYADITVEELREMMVADHPFLVNVHIPYEVDLPGTDQSIRFDEIAQHLDQLPQDKSANIVLYCRSGRMSAEAGGVLASLGYTQVSNLVGGFRAWEAAGYEVVRKR